MGSGPDWEIGRSWRDLEVLGQAVRLREVERRKRERDQHWAELRQQLSQAGAEGLVDAEGTSETAGGTGDTEKPA
ncbi:hypothetical protein GCM10027199_80790 [Amycolatopsis magusensis]